MVDIRDLIEYETPHNLAELLTQAGTTRENGRCSICGQASDALPPTQLSLIKFRQSGTPKGNSRLYCDVHLRQWHQRVPVPARRASTSTPAPPDPTVCPTCFLVMPLTGACVNCE